MAQHQSVADNGGINKAYLAYEAWVAANKQEKRLPGLPYTPQQMFWVSMANMMCEKAHPFHMASFALNPWYTPFKFRVNVPLSNSAEFSKDFNCPVGSKMNPIKKCVVW